MTCWVAIELEELDLELDREELDLLELETATDEELLELDIELLLEELLELTTEEILELACDITEEAATEVGVLLMVALLDGPLKIGWGSGCPPPEAPQAVKKPVTKMMEISLLNIINTVIHLRV